mgnify:CR=1 FL=1
MSCKLSFTLLCIAMLASCISTKMDPPQPYGALPTDRQLAWHEMEMYNMIEFIRTMHLIFIGDGVMSLRN